MKFQLEVDMSNAAFGDGGAVDEIVRILHRAAVRIEETGSFTGRILDINGNTVGFHGEE